ncbi:MAG: hypothetical protein ACOCRL_00020 [Bacillota bacterium]
MISVYTLVFLMFASIIFIIQSFLITDLMVLKVISILMFGVVYMA